MINLSSKTGLAALAGLAGLAAAGWPIWRWALPALLGAIPAALALVAMLLLPGLALARLLWPGELDPDERWPLALGLSCAVPPLLLLASEPLGLRWGAAGVAAFLALCALVALWPRPGPRPAQGAPAGPQLLLLLITAAALAARLFTTRELVAGQFGDSLHHTLITQLLVDNGGLFRSWEPYAELTTFTYHYGFHSAAAWLSRLSGLPARLSLLVLGQAQSALAAPLLYLLTRRLGGGREAGLWAATLAALVCLMPAYYSSWGRYTQLGGQTALVAVAVVWMGLVDGALAPRPSPAALLRLGGLAGISTAGLALIHYRVAIFAACFVAAYALVALALRARSWRRLGLLAGAGLGAAALAALLFTPWLLRLREGTLLQIGSYYASRNVGTDGVNAIPAALVALAAPWYLALPALAGLGLLLWRRRWAALSLPLGAGLIGLAANPFLVGLPGAGLIGNFSVLIASYLLLAPLCGLALGELLGLLGPRLRGLAPPAALLAGAALAAWGLTWQPYAIERQNELLTPADLRAMDWLRANTAPDDQIFVSSFPAYGGNLYAGSDAGWWLGPLTGRDTNLPPITYGSEAGPTPDYRLRVNERNAAILARPATSQAGAASLVGFGYDYLYNGPAASPPGEYVDPAALAGSPFYELVYDEGGVTIWRVR